MAVGVGGKAWDRAFPRLGDGLVCGCWD